MSGRDAAATRSTGRTAMPVFQPFPFDYSEFAAVFISLCSTDGERHILK
jgi:hypothetical protein